MSSLHMFGGTKTALMKNFRHNVNSKNHIASYKINETVILFIPSLNFLYHADGLISLSLFKFQKMDMLV